MQGPHASQLITEFAQLSHTLAEAPDEDARLQIAVSSAVSLMDGCDHAGFTVNLRSGLTTRASSSGSVVSRTNELQQELDEGPCLDALRDEETIISRDLSVEPRWPLWASRVHRELGLGSMMSLLVYREKQRSYGALSLYAEQGHRFEADDWAIGQALAGHISVILRGTSDRPARHRGAHPDQHRPGPGHPDGAAGAERRPGLRLPATPVLGQQPQARGRGRGDRTNPRRP